jgi:hypothetical protein
VFGVLEVILRHDPVPSQGFGAGQGQIAFIASFEILNVARLGADEPRRLISLGGLRSSQHSVGHNFRILAPLPRCWFMFRDVFHIGPKPDDVHSRRWGARLTLKAFLSVHSFQPFAAAREGSVSNRYCRSFGTAQSDDLRVELLC